MGRKKIQDSEETYEFFVEPNNEPTNEICNFGLKEEDFLEGVRDKHNVEHNLWRCNLRFIQFLKSSKTSQNQISFNTFSRNKLTNELSEFDYLPKNSPKKSANKQIAKMFAKLEADKKQITI